MTAKGFLRGHEIYWDGEEYRYVDDDTSTVEHARLRPCGHCGLHNTPEGHDGCLGTLPEVMNACCGHGNVDEAYVQYDGGRLVRGARAVQEMEDLKEAARG